MTIGNLDLKSEKNNYFSLSAEYVHERFSVSVNAFYNNIRDMIDYNTIATGDKAMEQYGHKEVRQRDNIAEAKVHGINVSANAYLGAGFNLSGGYTHLNTQDVELEQPIDKSIKKRIQYQCPMGAFMENISVEYKFERPYQQQAFL